MVIAMVFCSHVMLFATNSPVLVVSPFGEVEKTVVLEVSPVGERARTTVLVVSPVGEVSRTIVLVVSPVGEVARTIVLAVMLACGGTKTAGLVFLFPSLEGCPKGAGWLGWRFSLLFASDPILN